VPVVTPTLILCDELVALLAGAWGPSDPDGVERHYYRRWGDADSGEDELAGRRVVIYPQDYQSDAETRGEDKYRHRIVVQVVERYTDGGDPPKEWMDERVDFVYARVVQLFDFGRSPPAWNKRLRTDTTTVSVYDLQKLMSGGKLFMSQVEFEFSELRDA
jgi:hypothetical protein